MTRPNKAELSLTGLIYGFFLAYSNVFSKTFTVMPHHGQLAIVNGEWSIDKLAKGKNNRQIKKANNYLQLEKYNL